MAHVIQTATFDRLHDRSSGRLNADSVASLYDLPLRQLASVIDESYETLRKNPCRSQAQPALAALAHAWNNLTEYFGGDETIARWLHHPMPQNGRRPLDLLLGHNGLRNFTNMVGRMASGTYR